MFVDVYSNLKIFYVVSYLERFDGKKKMAKGHLVDVPTVVLDKNRDTAEQIYTVTSEVLKTLPLTGALFPSK